MWLPPGYRRERTVRYWVVLAAIAGVSGIALAVAAVVAAKPFQFTFVALFIFICVMSLLALREQHYGKR